MTVSLADFWKLASDSRLLTADQCRQLNARFRQVKGTPQPRTLAEWLISRNVLTRYETTVLLAGRPGPFFYGDYRISDHVSGGPPGGMFRAVHQPTGHPVSLQFVSGPATRDAAHWAALVESLRPQADIRHPHLQRWHAVVDLGTYKFLVFEALAGQSLDQTLACGRRLPPAEACRIARCAALALADLHQHGTRHGDLRPAQLWLAADGCVKVVRDPVGGPAPVPWNQPENPGFLLERADYLAPELAQPGRPPDAASEIYALGGTLYHLLSGQPPFPGGDAGLKMQRHRTALVPPLEPQGVPAAIAQIVTRMLAKPPALRPQQAAEVVAQLTPFVAPTRLTARPGAPEQTLAAFEQALRGPPVPVAAPAIAAPSSGAAASDNHPPGTLGAVPTRPASGRRAASRNRATQVTLAVTGAATLLALGLALWLLVGGHGARRAHSGGAQGRAPSRLAADPARPPPPTAGGAADGLLRAGDRWYAAPDDGTSLWASPTAGPPVALQYVPPGAQFFLIVRPGDLLATPHGERTLRALGPVFTAMLADWERAAGVALGDAEKLLLSLHPERGAASQPAFVVRLREPLDQATLLKKWGQPAATGTGRSRYFQAAGGWAFGLPAGAPDGLFVMGAPAQIKDVLEARGAAPTLSLALGKLLSASDDHRHVTVLFSPNELLANVLRDAAAPATYQPRQLREALAWFLGDDIEAGMISLHGGPRGYVELVLAGQANRRKGTLTEEVRDRLRQLPDHAARYLATRVPDPYWEPVARRFPEMVGDLVGQTRVGTENGLVVANAILPPAAIHNLLFASEQALAAAPAEGQVERP